MSRDICLTPRALAKIVKVFQTLEFRILKPPWRFSLWVHEYDLGVRGLPEDPANHP